MRFDYEEHNNYIYYALSYISASFLKLTITLSDFNFFQIEFSYFYKIYEILKK